MKLTALGVFHTQMGKFLVFPCGCTDASVLEHDKKREHKASFMHMLDGKYKKPVWCTFETDYVFEDRPIEVEIED